MAVSSIPDLDQAQIAGLRREIQKNRAPYKLLDRYYEGERRLDRIGLAVPPELEMFKAAVNVPRMAVDEVVARQNLKGFQRSGSGEIDEALREAWENNNLGSQSTLVHQDARIFGRGFVSVTTNPDDKESPFIRAESPEGMAMDIDPLGRPRAALRCWRDGTPNSPEYLTLYTPQLTRWLMPGKGRGGWVDMRDPDMHELGRLPLVMFLNRHRTGRTCGRSEMADVLEKTDMIARLITNMGTGGEALAWPKRWAAGVKKDDFIDKDGKPLPVWEAYMTVIMSTANKEAKFGEFSAAELANFHKAVDALLSWCAAELGLPLRFVGQEATNPASEGAIKADESRLVRNVERKNSFDGDSWSWVMGIRERFVTGVWPPNNIRALWFDPATPTIAQQMDATVKAFQTGIISREGAWDELGWSEARKARERGYFAAEALDPVAAQLLRPAAGDAQGSDAQVGA